MNFFDPFQFTSKLRYNNPRAQLVSRWQLWQLIKGKKVTDTAMFMIQGPWKNEPTHF